MRALVAVLMTGAALVGGSLAGCTLEPRYVRPTPSVPQA